MSFANKVGLFQQGIKTKAEAWFSFFSAERERVRERERKREREIERERAHDYKDSEDE